MERKVQFEITVKNSHFDGTRSHPLPDTVHTVEVSVDFAKIAGALGRKAVKSKGGKSRALAGAVTVKHLGKK